MTPLNCPLPFPASAPLLYALLPGAASMAFEIFIECSLKLADIVGMLGHAGSLPKAEEDPGEARKLLRWLKNLKGIGADMEEWLAIGTPEEQIAKIKAVHQLLSIHAAQLRKAQKNNPG